MGKFEGISGPLYPLHRIAISNQRIIDIHNDNVLFTYKDYRDNQSKTLSLDYSEFIRRFLMHVLPKGFMRLRHYGILANRCRAQSLKIIRKVLQTPAPQKAQDTSHEQVTYPCPKCRKGQLVFKHKISPVTIWNHPLTS